MGVDDGTAVFRMELDSYIPFVIRYFNDLYQS
jgi:hypothetical protein